MWEQFFIFIFSVLTNIMMHILKLILVVLVLIQCTVVESDVNALANRFDCNFPVSNVGNSGGPGICNKGHNQALQTECYLY